MTSFAVTALVLSPFSSPWAPGWASIRFLAGVVLGPQAEKLGYYVLLPALFFHRPGHGGAGAMWPVRKIDADAWCCHSGGCGTAALLRWPLFQTGRPAFTPLFSGRGALQ